MTLSGNSVVCVEKSGYPLVEVSSSHHSLPSFMCLRVEGTSGEWSVVFMDTIHQWDTS